MEWLDFARWSPLVRQQLTAQAARLNRTVHAGALPARESEQLRRERLRHLLRQAPATNPWGHPSAEA